MTCYQKKIQKLEDQAGSYSVDGDFRDGVMMAQNYKDMKGLDVLESRLPEIGKKPTFSNVHVDI